MKKLNQKGFSIWELLLLLLVLLILAAIGYWIWQQRGENKPAGDTTPAQSQKKEDEKPQEKAKKYLEIKELGIKVELTDAIEDAYYVMQNGYAYISTTALKNADPECAADKTSVVAIGKYKKADVDEQSGKTYEELAMTSGKVIGNDAYYMNRSQAYCSDDKTIQQKQQAAWDAFKAQATTIQAL